jgi:Cytochrome C oxidase, cbb3-type, subunit III
LRQGLGLCAAAALVLVAGCRQDMHDQPKFFPQRGTSFFPDGRSVRDQVAHTVARGQAQEADFFHTGLQDGKEVDALPFPVTLAVLERGQEQFNTYCTPCHSRVGNGAGMIVERGYKPAGNFHDAKRLAEPLSHYFYVISNGLGAMPDYAAQVTPADRWAIAAYIRALQLSEVAEQQGLPASYAQPWKMPDTAVYAMPSGGNTPAMAPAEPNGPPDASRHPQIQLPNGDSPVFSGGAAAVPSTTAKPAAGKQPAAKAGASRAQ